ncbi:MAG TPA: hypothetical protein G4O12_06725 [Dehalococcoidia bacterium]|nr:hypothetical protein [Dehalococcoidia bacterium]
MNSILRLCLCLILIGLIAAGATMCTERSERGMLLPGVQVCQAANDGGYAQYFADGKPPDIRLFEAKPLELDTDDSAIYTFVVRRATKVQIIEAGNTIKDIINPSAATLKGTVKGLTASAIQTGDSNTFDAVLKAINESGEVDERVTLSFVTELPSKPAPLIPPVSLSAPPRSPQWKEQYSLPLPTQPMSTTTHNEPDFFKCPSNCNYCLKPDEAASLGFTQRCSEQLCYYSPDNQQKWYCYSEPEGWCCKDNKVIQATKTECARLGGDWYANQAEAVRACQPMCWCCAGGKVGQIPQTECAQIGGACYSTQAQAMQACQPMCWCCAGGKVVQTTQTQCTQMGGACYATQAEATRACQRYLK